MQPMAPPVVELSPVGGSAPGDAADVAAPAAAAYAAGAVDAQLGTASVPSRQHAEARKLAAAAEVAAEADNASTPSPGAPAATAAHGEESNPAASSQGGEITGGAAAEVAAEADNASTPSPGAPAATAAHGEEITGGAAAEVPSSSSGVNKRQQRGGGERAGWRSTGPSRGGGRGYSSGLAAWEPLDQRQRRL